MELLFYLLDKNIISTYCTRRWISLLLSHLVVLGCLPKLDDLLVPGLAREVLLLGRPQLWPPYTRVVHLVGRGGAGVVEPAIPNVLILRERTELVLIL